MDFGLARGWEEDEVFVTNALNDGCLLALKRVKPYQPSGNAIAALMLDSDQLSYIRYLIQSHEETHNLSRECVVRNGDLLDALNILQSFINNVKIV